MKHITTILLLFSIHSFTFSQSINTLEYNNVSTVANDGGTLFSDIANSIAKYEVPKGSGKTAIFGGSFWFAATDLGGQLKMSLQTYTPNTELFPGPACLLGADYYDSTDYINQYMSSIWKVNKAEIDNHILNYSQPGYTIPSSIANWPGNGDVNLQVSENLAPFVDLNGDNVYDPSQGDYPKIRGDEALYIIMNDRANPHAYGSEQMGIEVHVMLYQYATSDFLDNTTFVNLKVYNRGPQTLYNFHSTFFMDFDLGNYDDDYSGSDSTRNLMFVYNGDSFDEDGLGVTGYGTNPPAVGVVCLNEQVNSIKQTDILSTLPEYYNVMNGLSPSGASEPLYVFHGNPNDPSELGTEYALGFLPGDRKMIMSVNNGEIQSLTGRFCLDFAIAYNDADGDHLSNAEGLFGIVDSIQAFYDAQNYACEELTASLIENAPTNTLTIYPNPSKGHFQIDFGQKVGKGSVEVHSVTGDVIVQKELNGVNGMDLSIGKPGVYFVRIDTGDTVQNKKVIVQ